MDRNKLFVKTRNVMDREERLSRIFYYLLFIIIIIYYLLLFIIYLLFINVVWLCTNGELNAQAVGYRE